jgi:hypothetical protein
MMIHITPNKYSIQVNKHCQQEASAATPHKLLIRYQCYQYHLHKAHQTAAHENLIFFFASFTVASFQPFLNPVWCKQHSQVLTLVLELGNRSKIKSHQKRQRCVVQAEKQQNQLLWVTWVPLPPQNVTICLTLPQLQAENCTSKQ